MDTTTVDAPLQFLGCTIGRGGLGAGILRPGDRLVVTIEHVRTARGPERREHTVRTAVAVFRPRPAVFAGPGRRARLAHPDTLRQIGACIAVLLRLVALAPAPPPPGPEGTPARARPRGGRWPGRPRSVEQGR
jgi:hypothetical protein